MVDFTMFQKDYLHQKEYVEKFLATHHRPLGTAAYEFAKKRHLSHFRDDGAPYIVHLVEVVYYLILIEFDDDISIAAGFNHDGPEDGKMTLEELIELLTNAVGYLVSLLTNPKKGMTLEELKEHLMHIFGEIRALVIKIIDRVANMKRSMIGYFDFRRLTRYCNEGEYVFIPMLEGFIAVIEDQNLLDSKYKEYYEQYARYLRILRSFLKGFVQAGREHLKLMEKNEALQKQVWELYERICESELLDYEP